MDNIYMNLKSKLEIKKTYDKMESNNKLERHHKIHNIWNNKLRHIN